MRKNQEIQWQINVYPSLNKKYLCIHFSLKSDIPDLTVKAKLDLLIVEYNICNDSTDSTTYEFSESTKKVGSGFIKLINIEPLKSNEILFNIYCFMKTVTLS